ncbi:major facilitator superfamily transporter domain-containing protein 5 [Moniliophthora roreri]|nr:major facilitator superfamily transporter domain-containing protein 5 [Moniliophthora roreri]
MSNFYERQLLWLTGTCVFSLFVEHQVSKRKQASNADARREKGSSTMLSTLMRQYLVVYAIVMCADWLQGPYVYSLYREQYGFPERLVAVLFVTGFMSAGLTAPLVGAWADQYGRRRLCLVFCVTYTITCCCILFPFLPILLCGRIFGGISTSILFSAFESWVVSASQSMGLPQSDLSMILGRATLVNGFVAAGSGVVSNQLVGYTSSFASPFVASGALLVLSYVVIRGTWSENFGNSSEAGAAAVTEDLFQTRRLGQAWRIVQKDPLLLVLGFTQTCFEGGMYLFVFLWVPSLQEASLSNKLPLGYIFSAFMVSMMLGSLLYTVITTHFAPPVPNSQLPNPSSTNTQNDKADTSLTLHAKLSSSVCAASALALVISVTSQSEYTRFWAFCAFEACVGMYYPVQGMLRGTLISNEHRATLSALFRVPLNVFVVVSLLTGVSSARYAVLSATSLMLAVSSILTGVVIVGKADTVRDGGRPLRG